jgi:hypothetical protein
MKFHRLPQIPRADEGMLYLSWSPPTIQTLGSATIDRDQSLAMARHIEMPAIRPADHSVSLIASRHDHLPRPARGFHARIWRIAELARWDVRLGSRKGRFSVDLSELVVRQATLARVLALEVRCPEADIEKGPLMAGSVSTRPRR